MGCLQSALHFLTLVILPMPATTAVLPFVLGDACMGVAMVQGQHPARLTHRTMHTPTLQTISNIVTKCMYHYL